MFGVFSPEVSILLGDGQNGVWAKETPLSASPRSDVRGVERQKEGESEESDRLEGPLKT